MLQESTSVVQSPSSDTQRERSASTITLLYWSELSEVESNAAKLIGFAGIECKPVKLTSTVIKESKAHGLIGSGANMIASAQTLARVAGEDRGIEWIESVLNTASHCFVFGFEPGPQDEGIIRHLTSNRLKKVLPIGHECVRFSVVPGTNDVCRQLAGVDIGTPDPKRDRVFDGSLNSVRSLVRIGALPCFVCLRHANCELFLAAGGEPADLDLPVSNGDLLKDFFPQTAPLLIFIRHACAECCWQNPAPQACLILDDPLLQNHYGFLDYGKLLASMEQENFSTSIAFIPWNYRRSKSSVVSLFRRAPDRFSLCVHGCDHTGGEFGEVDSARLRALARTGLDRMKEHEQLTGLPCDRVMVFPQGCFSSAALPALRACGYLAAINSTPYPADSATPLRLRDLLEVTANGPADFPLFLRRYPNDLESLAFDLFLGKPALIVEHHGYFRSGYAPLANLVRRLRSLEPRLQWSTAAESCSRTSLHRCGQDGTVHVRFFTDLFRLTNTSGVPQKYSLARNCSALDTDLEVLIDGKPVRWRRAGNEVCITHQLNPGASAEFHLRCPGDNSEPWPTAKRMSQRVTVFVRRRLSEFRDNCVDKSAFLSRMTSQIRNRLVRRK